MQFTYIDENGKAHKVGIHNFSKSEPDMVRIMGNITLNPTDKNYPDKKWVKRSEVLAPAVFSEGFVENNSF